MSLGEDGIKVTSLASAYYVKDAVQQVANRDDLLSETQHLMLETCHLFIHYYLSSTSEQSPHRGCGDRQLRISALAACNTDDRMQG